jgi:hypothetical protein
MMEHVELNPSERKIIEELRTLRPYERIEIVADGQGKPETYLITRTQKTRLTVHIFKPIP